MQEVGLARQARMVLLAADGLPNAEIARIAGVSRPTMIGWRDRYAASGIGVPEDMPGSGRSAEVEAWKELAGQPSQQRS